MNKKKRIEFKLYDEENHKVVILTYENIISSIKIKFLNVIKDCNIDNKLRAEHKVADYSKMTIYSKYLNKHPELNENDIDLEVFEFIESLYLDTLRILDIDNILPDNEKYVTKKYNNLEISLHEKLEVRGLIEPNLWNRFDDYSKLGLEKYDFDTFNYNFQFRNYLDDFIRFFITHIMFYWGDGFVLPIELNPILPYLAEKKQSFSQTEKSTITLTFPEKLQYSPISLLKKNKKIF